MSTQQLQAMLAYHHQSRHYPGALIHIEGDNKVLAHLASGTLRGYEQADAPSDADPMHDQVPFRIASLTKGMVSMVALRLIDEGRFSLDMPVSDVLPELAAMRLSNAKAPSNAPTLRHALSHTAGFGSLGETTDPQAREQCAAVPLEGQLAVMTREQFLQGLAQRVLTAEPGSQFQYGFSTDVVAQMIERVTGKSLQGALSQYLFEPLGMSDTRFHLDPAEHRQMPRAFSQDNAWHKFVAVFDAADERVHELKLAADSLDGPLQSGGGGLVSTLADVSGYARMLAKGGVTETGERLITESLFAQAMSNQLGPNVPGPYNFTGGGFGFGLAGAIRNDWAPAAFPSQPGEFSWSGITGHTLFVRPGKGWFALMLSSNTASRVIVRFEFRRAAASA